MSLLRVEGVSYTYSKNTPMTKNAVHGVSFAAESGEVIGIIGHTGSGKSTLLQILNGLIKPDAGRVLFQNADIWQNPKEISKFRYQIGLVFQYPEYQLFEETVYKDIAYGPKNMGLSESEIHERVMSSCETVGLDGSFLEKSPFDLSGGEKRRAAIAGIIAMRPKVLVLDEPTAGLDPKGREMLLEMILNYRKTTDAAVLIVSHSMEDLAKVADKLLVLNHGKSVMFDETPKIFSRSAELVEMGLDVPMVTRVFMGLKAKGFLLSDSVFTVSQAKSELIKLLKEGSLHA